MEEEIVILERIEALVSRPRGGRLNLITLLQEVQKELGWLPPAGMERIARALELSPANVEGVASFYNQFRFTPPGRCHVRVCMGTACHIKQGDLVLDQWKRKLEIEEGERSADGEFSLERVACVGACAQAPVSIVCDEVVGQMSPTRVEGIILQHQLKREQEERERKKEQAESGAARKDGSS
jgi:NADH-quinone oxidoreductase subunit E